MGWLSEAFFELKEALGVRRHLIIGFVGAAVGVISWWYDFFMGVRMSAPELVSLGLAVGALYVAVCLLGHTVELRRKVTPRVTMEFDPQDGCVVDTRWLEHRTDGSMREIQAKVVRMKVVNCGKLTARDCAASVTAIERKIDEGAREGVGFQDTLDLPWSHSPGRDYSPAPIPGQQKKYFDIAYCQLGQDQLRLNCALPFRLENVFEKPSTYRVGLAVRCDEAVVTKSILIEWNGNCDGIKAYEAV